MNFTEKWLAAVEGKNSVLCAGLDPADFKMGRGDEGLPEGKNKLEWAIHYINAISNHCAAIKPNTQYWKGEKDSVWLRGAIEHAKGNGLVVIDDVKLADIGSTNGAGVFYSAEIGSDALTIAPYAGNMGETSGFCRERGIGAITMCLMSNPEYAMEKEMLVSLSREDQESYELDDLVNFDGLGTNVYVKRYVQLAHDAKKFGLDGIVIGAPSGKNHIKEKEIEKARHYVGKDMLALVPGVGAQGGEARSIFRHFGPSNVIVNVGRGLMFPNGPTSSFEDYKSAARRHKDMLNGLRQAQ